MCVSVSVPEHTCVGLCLNECVCVCANVFVGARAWDRLFLGLAEGDWRLQGRGALRTWSTLSVSAWSDALGGHWGPRSCSRPPEPGSRIFSVSPPEHPVLPDLHAFAFRTPSLPSLRGAVTEAVDFLTVGGQGLSWRGPVPSLPNFSKGESAWYFLFSRDKNYYALTMCQKIYIPVPYFLTTVF